MQDAKLGGQVIRKPPGPLSRSEVGSAAKGLLGRYFPATSRP